MKYLVLVVTLTVCVVLGHCDVTDGKTELSDIVVDLKQEMADLIQHQEMKLSKTVTTLTKVMEQKHEYIEDEIIQLKDMIKATKGNVGGVMFSAYMTSGEYNPTPPDDVIVPFDQVDVNIGNHFNTATHTFVCPEDGFYFFTFSLHSRYQDGSYPWTAGSLKVDGNVVSSAISFFPGGVSRSSQSSASVLTNCSNGNEVRIEADSEYAITIYGDSTIKESTFAGFLLASLQ